MSAKLHGRPAPGRKPTKHSSADDGLAEGCRWFSYHKPPRKGEPCRHLGAIQYQVRTQEFRCDWCGAVLAKLTDMIDPTRLFSARCLPRKGYRWRTRS